MKTKIDCPNCGEPITALQMLFDPTFSGARCSSCLAILGSERLTRLGILFSVASSVVILGAIISVALYFKLVGIRLFFHISVGWVVLWMLAGYIFVLWILNTLEFQVLKKSTQKLAEGIHIFHSARPIRSFQMTTLIALSIAGSWRVFLLYFSQGKADPLEYVFHFFPALSFGLIIWALNYDEKWALYLGLVYAFLPFFIMAWEDVLYFVFLGGELLWLSVVITVSGITLSAFSFIKWRHAKKYLLSINES